MRSPSLTLFLLLSVLGAAMPAHAAIGPDTRLPGVDPQTWKNIYERADRVAKEVAKANPSATAEQLACAKARAQFEAYRRAQALDALRDAPRVFVHMSPKDGPHQSGHVEQPKATNPKYQSAFSYEADEPGGATQRLRDEYNQRCHGGDGGGGGGPGSPVEGSDMAQAWLDEHPNWDIDDKYGPPLLPGDAVHLGAQVKKVSTSPDVRERVEKSYPGAQFDALVGRFVSGRATGQDVEQLRVLLGLAGSVFVLNAKGLVSAPARMLPIWWVPSDSVLPGHSRQPKPGEGL